MREFDLSKPLSEKDVEYLRQRLPNEQVDHMVPRAEGGQFEGVKIEQLQDPDGAAAHSEGARSETDGNGDVKQMQEGDDPADFTVNQVVEYLESATDEERERVLSAEEDGEGRVGILG